MRGIENLHLHSTTVIGHYCLLDAASFGGGRISVGRKSEIHDFCRLQAFGGAIEIGDDCSLNPFCVVYGHGGVSIGDKVRIATGCVIIPANHTFADVNLPIMSQPESRRGIRIDDDVWIGARVVVLDGVTIGRGAVVGAGSVVTRNVAPWSVVAGSPATLVKRRQ